jgi:hypothetical protein
MTSAKQTVVSDDVVRKIQLLFNLAERAAGNEVEAAAAMAKAQDLLEKYNLDLATVQDAVVAGGTNATKEEIRREKADAKRNATYAWTQDLYRAIAEANYCKYWAAETRIENEKTGRVRWVKRHRVLGRVDNTTVVLMMGDYLYATIMRLLPHDKSSWLSADAIAWCDGCVERLTERIKAKAEAARTPDYATQGETGYCTALAVKSMVEREAQGNYEAEHGIGSWAKKLEREAVYAVYWSAEAVALREAEAAKKLAVKLAAETPAEKKTREREEARAEKRNQAYSERYWDRADRRQEREARKRSSSAFQSGRAVGGSIGIDGQVGAGKGSKNLN